MKKAIYVVIVIAAFILGVSVGISGSDKSSTTSTTSSSSNPAASDEVVKDTGKVEINGAARKTLDGGYTKLVGEVKNNTKSPASSVKVTATFYDEKGAVIGTSFTYAGDTSDTPLAVGATVPFEISSYPDKFDTEKYKLDVTWR